MSNLPQLVKKGKHTLLHVDGKPFTILGGELHNSSSSNAEYMKNIIWPSIRGLNMNAVIFPIFWENIEPVEGSFDFSLVDELIEQARAENMKLVPLWFGLWKNGKSTYVPGWVKENPEKFFYVQDAHGLRLQTISPLCLEAVEADAAAFSKLMAHIREFDGGKNTVIMMQVENEIGVLGAPRDFSPVAESSFKAEVPEEVAGKFNVSGSWQAAFGNDACEYFMAYHYAAAVERIASLGKAEYGIPVFVNAWLEQFPSIPGVYPSGGPVAKVADMWQLRAPTIECYAPDIYVENYRDVCDEYAAIPGNPLCIPEVRATLDSVPFMLYAVGKHNAICFSPFGIEDLLMMGAEGMSADLLSTLNISAAAFRVSPKVGANLAHAYKQIGNMQDIIQIAHEEKRIHAFLQLHDNGQVFRFSDYVVKVTYNGASSFFRPAEPRGEAPVAGGFIIELGNGEFLIAAVGCRVEFLPATGDRCVIGVKDKQEGTFENNKWIAGRTLNGDEGYFHSFGDSLTIMKISVFKY